MEVMGEEGGGGGGKREERAPVTKQRRQVRQRRSEGISSGVPLIRQLLVWHRSGALSPPLCSSLAAGGRTRVLVSSGRRSSAVSARVVVL